MLAVDMRQAEHLLQEQHVGSKDPRDDPARHRGKHDDGL